MGGLVRAANQACRAGLVAVGVKVEVFFGDFVVGAIGADGFDGRVDLADQLFLAFAGRNANAIAVVLGVVLVRANVAVVLALGLAQEAAVYFHLVGHSAIQAASVDVQVHLVLRFVGHDL